MAKISEFLEKLKSRADEFEYKEYDLGGKMGYMVENKIYDTRTHFTLESIEKNELVDLVNETYHGKYLEHMTRVTGFFSKVESWNKGKLGELKDRTRDRNFAL